MRLLSPPCLSVCTQLFEKGWIDFMASDTDVFYWNCSTLFNFGSEWTTITASLQEDDIVFLHANVARWWIPDQQRNNVENPPRLHIHPARQTPDTPPTLISLTADNSDAASCILKCQKVKFWRKFQICYAVHTFPNLLEAFLMAYLYL
jgi:hypothetical protein